MFLTRMLVPATQTSIAQFGKYYLGPMLTNSGPVCIRDNGPGGKAVIVDGSTTLYIYDVATQLVTYSTAERPTWAPLAAHLSMAG
jgi:hypothetical protein